MICVALLHDFVYSVYINDVYLCSKKQQKMFNL